MVEPAMDVTMMLWQLQCSHMPASLGKKHAGIGKVAKRVQTTVPIPNSAL